jgi:predicted transcriptional regulator
MTDYVYLLSERDWMMTTIELKKLLRHRIDEIDDESFLNAIKTILDTKSQSQIIKLSDAQRLEIEESKKQIAQGLFIEQTEIDKEFNKWLSAK